MIQILTTFIILFFIFCILILLMSFFVIISTLIDVHGFRKIIKLKSNEKNFTLKR